MMTFEEFEKMMSRKPAKITATCDEKDNTSIEIEGRGIELLALSLEISENVLSKLPLTADDYCEILKDGINMKKTMSKETIDKENEEIKKAVSKIFEDLFK